MGDSKAGKGPQHKTQTSAAGDAKGNNNESSKSCGNDHSKADKRADSAAGAKKKENKKLRELGKLVYGCQSFGN